MTDRHDKDNPDRPLDAERTEALDGRPSKAVLLARSAKLQVLMASQNVEGALFFQNADLIYLCGTMQAEAVFVPRAGRPLVLARSPLDRVEAETALEDLAEMPPWPDLADRLDDWTGSKVDPIGLELDVLPVNFYRRLGARALAGRNLVDASGWMRQARMVKDDFEILQMRIAARKLDEVFSLVPGLCISGMTELELEARLTGAGRMGGHQGFIRTGAFNMEMYYGHVLSGSNSLILAKVDSPTGGRGVGPGWGQGAGVKPIVPGDLISVDLVGAHAGYLVDQTRIFHLGEPKPPIAMVYDRLLELVGRLNDFIRPGLTGGEVHGKAWDLAGELGLSNGFMGLDASRCPFIGHGVGLELDEWPVLGRGVKTVLAVGSTYTLEPRVFLPGPGRGRGGGHLSAPGNRTGDPDGDPSRSGGPERLKTTCPQP